MFSPVRRVVPSLYGRLAEVFSVYAGSDRSSCGFTLIKTPTWIPTYSISRDFGEVPANLQYFVSSSLSCNI